MSLDTRSFEHADDRVPPKFDARWSVGPSRVSAAAEGTGGRITEFDARHTIVDETQPARCSYMILEGSVMISKMLPDGRRQIIELLGPGDVFGITTTGFHESAAETLTPVRVAAYDRAGLARDSALQLVFAERLKNQICALHDHAMLLGRKTARERVATFLMRLIPGRGGSGCLGPRAEADRCRVTVALTRQEIADYLGLTLETVSRAFSQLKREGVLAYGHHDLVTVTDVCRLCRETGAH
jgi:CRP/FNR family nitrogen fixation transcriptional regulator